MRTATAALLLGLLACSAPPAEHGARHAGGATRGYAPDPFVGELLGGDPGARVELDTARQTLVVARRAPEESLRADVDDLVAGFVAYWITALGSGELCLAGRDELRGGGALAVVRIAGGELGVVEVLAVPGSAAVTCVDELPDGRIAALDGVRHGVHLCELASGVVTPVARVEELPELARGRYVGFHEATTDDGRTVPALWITEVRERDLALGVLAGRVTRLRDLDGEGTFETFE